MNLTCPKGVAAVSIVKRLQESGHQALLAGGCVRDHLLGFKPTDYDIATSATPDQIEKIFSKTIPVGRQFGVMLVILNSIQFEVATFRTEGGYQDGRRPGFVNFSNAEEDASRRDFTVNGLFYDPIQHRVLDYVGGVKDLSDELIRCIGDPAKRFEEDKLRLMRAIRFSARLGFAIEVKTWDEIKLRAAQIDLVSKERIRDEIDKILTSPQPERGLSLLVESGLWKYLWPSISSHSAIIQRFSSQHLQGQLNIALAASLFFYGLAQNDILILMKDLRHSNEAIQKTLHILTLEEQIEKFNELRIGSMKLLVNDPFLGQALTLYQSHPYEMAPLQLVKEKVEEWGHQKLPKPYMNGDDLKGLGLKPGPKMKEILNEAHLLQLELVLRSKQEALHWAKKEMTKS